jgi:CDP-glycerol glycerophosphotransferase
MIRELIRYRAVKRLLRFAVWLGRMIAPTRDHVVVYGWPQDEGNAVELVRHLGMRGVRVRWLLDEPPGPEIREILRTCPSVSRVSRLGVGGFLAYLTAGTTFFTHGLFLSPASPRRKAVVNLWHGDGPKRNYMPNGEPAPRCHFVVSCSTVFGRSKGLFFGVPEPHVLVTGNPRNDRFFREPDVARLSTLGLEPDRYVVYMPTYRAARALGSTVAWEDGRREDDPRRAVLTDLVKAAGQVGLQAVVKPHPLDAVALAAPGLRVLGDADLAAAGLNSYELLAASHCLITDYSSIWTDYLSTGKHVAFAVPDWEAYAATRGLDESIDRSLLPGPVVSTVDEMRRFFQAIEQGDSGLVTQRQRAIDHFGLVTTEGSSRRLVEELARRRVHLPGGPS